MGSNVLVGPAEGAGLGENDPGHRSYRACRFDGDRRCLCRPDAPSVVVVGDGAFMLGGLVEFNTAVRHGIDLIVMVRNDGCYGAEHGTLEAHGFDTANTLFAWPDFAPVAEALGGSGYTVRTAGDLDKLAEVIANRSRPSSSMSRSIPTTCPTSTKPL